MTPIKASVLSGIVVFLTIWITLTAIRVERDAGTYSLVAAVVIGILIYMAMHVPLYNQNSPITQSGWTSSAVVSTVISVIGIVVTIVIALNSQP